MFEENIEVISVIATAALTVLSYTLKLKYQAAKEALNAVCDALEDDNLSVSELKNIASKIKKLV